MKRTNLAAYLNDHLAGAVGITDLLEHLQRNKADTDLGGFLSQLREEVIADRLTLEAVMERAKIKKHQHRTALAWLVEKITRLKLRVEDTKDGELHLLEGLEMVEVGIEGKRELWRSLAVAAEYSPELQAFNYDYLIQRAVEQHDGVEAVRTETAKLALATT